MHIRRILTHTSKNGAISIKKWDIDNHLQETDQLFTRIAKKCHHIWLFVDFVI